MPSLHSHGNTNVSKVWFVVALSFVMMVSVVWRLFGDLEEIALSTSQMSAEMEQLMNDER